MTERERMAEVDPERHPILYRVIGELGQLEQRPDRVTIPQAHYILLLQELRTLRGQWEPDEHSERNPDVLTIAGTVIAPELN